MIMIMITIIMVFSLLSLDTMFSSVVLLGW